VGLAVCDATVLFRIAGLAPHPDTGRLQNVANICSVFHGFTAPLRNFWCFVVQNAQLEIFLPIPRLQIRERSANFSNVALVPLDHRRAEFICGDLQAAPPD